MVQIQARCQWQMLDSRWWNKLGKAFMRIATFWPFQWTPTGASEDIHLPKPLMCQPPAKSDTVQYNAWPVSVKHRGWGCEVWSPCLSSNLVCYLNFDGAPSSCGYDKKQMCFEKKRRTGKRAEDRKDGGGRRRLMGQEKKWSGSMLASDKSISVPPVGRSESLKL